MGTKAPEDRLSACGNRVAAGIDSEFANTDR